MGPSTPERETPVPPSSKQRFNIEAELLESPRIRRHVGALLRGWTSGQSSGTKEGRYLDLHQFAAFTLGEDLPDPNERDNTRAATVMLGLLRVQSGHAAVSGFIEWLATLGYSPQTQIRKVKTLRLWARYLREKRAASRDLDAFPIPSAASLKSRNEPHTLTREPTPREPNEVEHLSVEGRAHAHRVLETRDQAIVDMLTHSSLDHAQLLDLNWRNIDFGQHPVLEEDDPLAPPARVQVPRRDGRQYWRHLVPHATRTMRRWNRAYVSHFCAALPDRPVFATLTGKRLSPSRIYQIADG